MAVQLRLLFVGASFVGVLGVAHCGSSLGPECEAFAKCCDALGDAQCRRAAEESDRREGGESACSSARRVYVAAGQCADEEVEGAAPTPKACADLVSCCAQLAGETSACLVSARQLEVGPQAAGDCATALQAYLSADRCRLAGVRGPEDDPTTCSDGFDNDGNGAIDCADRTCQQHVPACRQFENTLEKCTDGIDNDFSGRFDCNDTSCDVVRGLCVPERTNAACSDGYDNDADGRVDCQDRDCLESNEVTVCGGARPENTNDACSDGIDNDGDNYIDCDDYDCSRNRSVTVC